MAMAHALIPGLAAAQPLVFLHGSAQNELSMLPLARALGPQGTMLLLRGALAWEGGHAFIRRKADRSIDESSVLQQTEQLHGTLTVFARRLQWRQPPVLIGFSNGAIAAAALLMLYPQSVTAAALLRPLAPFVTPPAADLGAMPVLLIDASDDERRSPEDAPRLAASLAAMGASVTRHSLAGGHGPQEADADHLRQWLQSLRP